MSVSFYVDQYWTAPDFKANPDCLTYEEWEAAGGSNMKPDHVELNVANTNARVLLLLLSIDVDDEGMCGSISPNDLLAKIERIASRSEIMTEFTRSDEITHTPNRATLIECGLTTDRMMAYLNQLISVCDEAREMGREVVWA